VNSLQHPRTLGVAVCPYGLDLMTAEDAKSPETFAQWFSKSMLPRHSQFRATVQDESLSRMIRLDRGPSLPYVILLVGQTWRSGTPAEICGMQQL
jgi:hypothetical protein